MKMETFSEYFFRIGAYLSNINLNTMYTQKMKKIKQISFKNCYSMVKIKISLKKYYFLINKIINPLIIIRD